MEITLNRKPTIIKESVIHSTYEHPFEVDCTLPDYCRDIVKILHTLVTSNVSNSNISNNRLTIDGNNIVCIYYVDSDDNLAKYESNVPFSKIIELKSSPANPTITIDSYEGYVNCRAVSPRRLDIRGTIQLMVDVSDNNTQSIVEDMDCDDIEIDPLIHKGTKIVGQYVKQFTIKEQLDVINTNNPEQIFKYNAVPTITEYKLLPGKVIIKGTLFAHVLYLCENTSNMKICDYNLPFSQIIDCIDVDEQCVCDIRLKIINCDLSCINNQQDSINGFNLETTICANITAYKEITVKAINDCYCKSCESNFKTKNISLSKLIQIINTTHTHNELVELSQDCSGILDCWCKHIFYNINYKENTIVIDCKIVMCILCICDKRYSCVEKVTNACCEIPISTKSNINFCPHIAITKCSCGDINNCKTQCSCDVLITGAILESNEYCIIDDVKLDTDNRKPSKRNGVTIYYPHSKESLWDIAKRFNTSVNILRSENDLSDDFIDVNQILLITPR